MEFTKESLTLEQQLDLLIQRGIQCQDRQQALHYLRHLNYYRLSGYWFPFESNHAAHRFVSGTQFEDIINLYVFDRELRLLVMDVIERIEISSRTGLAYWLSRKHGPHAHLSPDIFKEQERDWHRQQLDKLKEDMRRRKHEVFVHHYSNKYDEPLPPLWVTVEIMSLGQLSMWYGKLRYRADRNAIAHRYDMDEGNFGSFLHHLTIVRNLCAHHSRLWNHEFTFKLKLPKHRPKELVKSLNPDNNRRIYNTLTTCAWLIDHISLNHHWKQKLKGLLKRHEINTDFMGFPQDFTEKPIWTAV